MKRLCILVLVVLCFLPVINLQAQPKFNKLDSDSGVEFYYRWKHEKKNNTDSPLVFIVKVMNTNDYKTEVAFTVDYFYKTLREASSEEQRFCIAPRKALVNDLKRTRFDRGNLTNQQLLSEDFVVELSGIRVQKAEKCKPGSNK